jgi:hypothetical protein
MIMMIYLLIVHNRIYTKVVYQGNVKVVRKIKAADNVLKIWVAEVQVLFVRPLDIQL